MISNKELYEVKEAAHNMSCVISPVKLQKADDDDDRGVVLEGEHQREVFIRYFSDSKLESNQKSEEIANYLIAVSPSVVQRLVAEIERLSQLEKQAEFWKHNHDNQAKRARILIDRPDMPVERVKAYNRMYELENENASLKRQIAQLSDSASIHSKLDMLIMNIYTDRENVGRKTEEIHRIITNAFRQQ